ncbi:hypothetical protein RHSP_39008 [Rhizobium freirei PRF 81]|uniref:Transmembrane protein n=1 Tax=Rhizobium freirei PRF 81 TaxID=363754 RepID=N6U693_9HYPH|nr:hypothetical protein [Rhizobium freirei]ENN88114.1 hypothetical protein RHSP_39008 [Rhizobium freirei PRF 81]
MEKELLLPFTKMEAPRHSHANSPKLKALGDAPKKGLPLHGIAILLGTVLFYALVISHAVGQPHYSARANLMPAVFVEN